ncbi:hypothetical protein U1Q18_020362 [Sarracenia purpurea var. burkii]
MLKGTHEEKYILSAYSHKLNLNGHCNGIGVEETRDLWVETDIDGNGVLNYKEFQGPCYQGHLLAMNSSVDSLPQGLLDFKDLQSIRTFHFVEYHTIDLLFSGGVSVYTSTNARRKIN